MLSEAMLATAAEEAVSTMILRFRAELDASCRGRMAAATLSCPPRSASRSGLGAGPKVITQNCPDKPRDVFTFSDAEVSRALHGRRTNFVIHHGAAPRAPDVTVRELATVHLMPLAPAGRGPVRLRRS